MKCLHGFDPTWLPCPYCHPEATEAFRGPKTPAAAAELGARKKSNASLGVQQPARTLDLVGKTVAGCVVDRMAANATNNSRFHCVMSCGHMQIVDGTTLTTAARAGKTLKCSPCSKIDGKASREAKRLARKAAKNG